MEISKELWNDEKIEHIYKVDLNSDAGLQKKRTLDL